MRRAIASFILLFFLGMLCTSTLMFFSSPTGYQAAAVESMQTSIGV